MSNTRVKKSRSQAIVFTMVSIFFTILSLTYLYILVWSFFAGIRTQDSLADSIMGFSDLGHFENFIYVFKEFRVGESGFLQMLFNSVYFAVLGPLIATMLTCMLAYATSKFKFFGSKFYYIATIVMISMPIYGAGGSAYKLYNAIGIVNSYKYIITSFSGLGLNYLIFSSAFRSLSWSYAEAAYIDGANDFQVFFKAMFPLVINVFGSLFVIAWVAQWNDYSNALLYLNDLPVLASGIYSFSAEVERVNESGYLYAAYFITAIPPLLLFIFCNEALTSNVSIGGLKE